jgi:hypothetical protein
MSRRPIAGCLALIAAAGFSCGAALAQSDTNLPPPPPMTLDAVEQFLTDAGLKACETSEIDPFVSRFHGAVRSVSVGVAVDCADYDPKDPTVVNVHQFDDLQARDAMVASLRDLRFRALRAYGSVWVVDYYVVVLLGPRRAEVEALLQAEYRRRHKK